MLNHAGYNPYVFSPRTITVKVGTRVVWRNRSSADHTVTASTSPAAFDSGTARLIHPKAQWSFVFRRPGRYAYYCLLHPFMKGIVIVTQ
jgi:plastocyanin